MYHHCELVRLVVAAGGGRQPVWNNEFSFEGVDAAKNELVVKVGEITAYIRRSTCSTAHPVAPHHPLPPLPANLDTRWDQQVTSKTDHLHCCRCTRKTQCSRTASLAPPLWTCRRQAAVLGKGTTPSTMLRTAQRTNPQHKRCL
jgi:hypothetical protein